VVLTNVYIYLFCDMPPAIAPASPDSSFRSRFDVNEEHGKRTATTSVSHLLTFLAPGSSGSGPLYFKILMEMLEPNDVAVFVLVRKGFWTWLAGDEALWRRLLLRDAIIQRNLPHIMFAKLVARMPRLTYWTMLGALERSPYVQVNCSKSPMTGVEFKDMISRLAVNKNLETLDLIRFDLRDEKDCVSTLAKAVRAQQSLRVLWLSQGREVQNSFGALLWCPSLLTLGISKCLFADFGKDISEGLKISNSRLRSLHLPENELTCAFLENICHGLMFNKQLSDLSLSQFVSAFFLF